jgi:RpiR family carbohydrate utilization transcriptional regulator
MSKILVKIESISKNLTSTDKQISEFIEKNYDQIPFLTIHMLAEKINSSAPTISRFVKKLGYSSYRDFKYDIVKDHTPADMHEIYEPISKTDSEEEIINKVFNANIEGLRDTLKILDFETMKAIAEHIARARRLYFLGMGGSGAISNLAAQRFLHLDIQCESLNDEYQIVVQSLRLDKRDVVVGISHSGRTRITLNGLRYAKEGQAVTVGISNYNTPQMRKVCDYQLLTAFKETRVRAAAISSFFLQVSLIEVLYLLVAKHKKQLSMLDELNRRIEENMRIQ